AVGRVEIATPQLNGNTQQLIANFRMRPASPPSAAPGASPYAVTPGAATGKRTAATNTQGVKASPVSQTRQPTQGDSSGSPPQKYQIDANQMQLEVFLEGKDAVPSNLACDGNIVLRQISQQTAGEQPVELRGAKLYVSQLESKLPHVTLTGANAA